MDHFDLGTGLVGGFLIGALLMVAAAVAIQGRGRDDCEKDLPREQVCSLKWVKP